MKKKIPTLQTAIPVSVVGNQNKRKDIYSDLPDQNEGNECLRNGWVDIKNKTTHFK